MENAVPELEDLGQVRRIGGEVLGIKDLFSLLWNYVDVREQDVMPSVERERNDLARWLYSGVKMRVEMGGEF